ncbi:MAG TPA: cation:proton antiporter [Frankiaceae bacterium]|nr:cation:proton antiporter [Frankiaceae bacterium]
MNSPLTELALIAVAAVLAPILSLLSGRLALPGVVIEILLGVLLGPSVLGWAHSNDIVSAFSEFGLAMLMFLAGYELDFGVVKGRPLSLAAASWGISLGLASIVGALIVLAGHRHGELTTGLALSTTALGTLLPILHDSRVLETPLGRHVLAVGSIGEFGPIVLVALVLGTQNPGITSGLLAAFALLAVAVAYVANRPWHIRIRRILKRGLHSSSQLPVRLSMLLIAAMVLLASHLGLDILLGAFAAGTVVRVAVSHLDDETHLEIFKSKLEGIGFGFVVPIFFVVSGVNLDLDAFSRHPAALFLIPLFFVLLFVVRGLPILLCYRHELDRYQRGGLALMAATGLPLIVVVATIGESDGFISTGHAAALVTAGMLSVLIFPAMSLRVLKRGEAARGIDPVPAPDDV